MIPASAIPTKTAPSNTCERIAKNVRSSKNARAKKKHASIPPTRASSKIESCKYTVCASDKALHAKSNKRKMAEKERVAKGGLACGLSASKTLMHEVMARNKA